ncbi:MAG TPA: phosphoethanolamine transferase domain-containing protein, partial [Ramlibacter sp.]|nr:phosphoethanolamine transferase domain-containing protein [Ramlibacter sp.]
MSRRAVSPAWVVAALAAWLATAGNLALWRKLHALGVAASLRDLPFALAIAAIVGGATAMLLGAFAWRATLKPVATLLLATAALASYFMLAYGVVIDGGMMTNALQTDWRETAALASWQMAAVLVVLGLLPAWLLWRQPVAYGGMVRQASRSLLLVAAGLLLVVGAGLLAFQPFASLMRNHKEVRYLFNPLATVYAAARVAARPWAAPQRPLVQVGEDATLGPLPASSQPRPRVLLLVLGETARSDNFSINGYA